MRAALPGLLAALLTSAAAAQEPGLRCGVEVGGPLIGVGVTTEAVGVRHALEYPVAFVTPGIGASLDLGRVWSVDLVVPFFAELACNGPGCETGFDGSAFGFRLSTRAAIDARAWTLALWVPGGVLVPGVEFALGDGFHAYGLLPVAVGELTFGVALHAGLGWRYGQ